MSTAVAVKPGLLRNARIAKRSFFPACSSPGHHRVSLARDGNSGIALARELLPDVVLCDIGLPDLSGYDVARALRTIDELRATRLIALTGYTQPGDKRRAEEAGFDAHLSKPPPLEELQEMVEDAGT